MFARVFFFLLMCVSLCASAREYSSTGFFYPLKDESPNFSQCGRWLERHPPNGCYDFQDSLGNNVYHNGSDMMASLGAAVYAIADGTVVYKSDSGWGSTDGKINVALLIEHKIYGSGTTFRAMYGHIQPLKSVGSQVKAGDVIGTIGNWPSGSHLHFGIIMPGKTYPLNSGYFGRWLDNKFGVVYSSQEPYYDNGLLDPIWFITHKTPDNWLSRADVNPNNLTAISVTNPWFPELCGGSSSDSRCDPSDVDSYVTCVVENSNLCAPAVKSYSAVNGGGNGSGVGAGGGGGGSYNLNQDTDIIDPATGVEWIAGQKQLVSGQVVNLRVQLQSEGGDVRNYIAAGKNTVETDFYVRTDSGKWVFLVRKYTQASNLAAGTHTETVSYTIPPGISEISFRVKVDATNEVSETNESDNWSRIETFRIDVSPWLIPIINLILED